MLLLMLGSISAAEEISDLCSEILQKERKKLVRSPDTLLPSVTLPPPSFPPTDHPSQ